MNAGSNSYIENIPPSLDIPYFHTNIIIPPDIIPAVIPYLLAFFQNNAHNTTGPNVAPNPAHANDTKGTGAYVVTTFVANRSGFDRSGNPDNECGNGWGYYDLGLHNENFILKAKELGLGTLVMGIRDGEKIKEMLEIPETEMVVSVISVGYIKENPPKPKRKDVDDILKFF